MNRVPPLRPSRLGLQWTDTQRTGGLKNHGRNGDSSTGAGALSEREGAYPQDHRPDRRIDIPTIISIELALFLVSLMIIWMIHRQSKVEHFQFWVLSSIEFQINLLSKGLNEIENRLK